MRKINFRGKTLDEGRYVYGYLIQTAEVYTHFLDYECAGYAELKGNPFAILTPQGKLFEVDPNTVAQLVGIDSNGNEIFEDDMLVDEKGFEYAAMLQQMVYWKPFDDRSTRQKRLPTSRKRLALCRLTSLKNLPS